jgi:hypothetical protein
MTDKEIMQQALDALKQSTPDQRVGDDDYCEQAFEEHLEAITVLRSRLEQPVIATEWIGLTDAQIYALAEEGVFLGTVKELAREIKVALKELNHERSEQLLKQSLTENKHMTKQFWRDVLQGMSLLYWIRKYRSGK